ncbi:MAG: alpha/beta hydrolase [Pseudomonadota bacterium]|nr:alpha/beta hydrolase [Pseudomonadota bacterium]
MDAQYDVDLSVDDYSLYARHYGQTSEAARARLPCKLDVPYGPTRAETLDIFPAAQSGAPVFVFLHGGYWRSLSSKAFSCVAFGLQEIGITTVVVDYALTPKVSLDEIVRQSRAAVAWVLRCIEGHGGDPGRIVLGGHSAGAQLTAMCLQTAWSEDYGIAEDPLAGAVLVSGIYDLNPLRFSCMQPELRLDDEIIRRNSPLFSVRRSATPALVTWGALETTEFHRQSDTYAAAWSACGNRVERWVQAGRNHFDAIAAFEDPASALCRWIGATVGR